MFRYTTKTIIISHLKDSRVSDNRQLARLPLKIKTNHSFTTISLLNLQSNDISTNKALCTYT